MKVKKIFALFLIGVQCGCVSLPLLRQNISLIPRNVSLWGDVVQANKTMLEKDLVVSVLVYPHADDVAPFFIVGDSQTEIHRQPYFQALSAGSSDACIVVYRYDIPLSPKTDLCYDLAILTLEIDNNAEAISENTSRIIVLEKDLATLEKAVASNTEKITLGAEATIQIFRTSATNSNVLTAQNEFYDSVRTSVVSTDAKITQIDAKFSGFQSSITRQMQSLNVNVVNLRSAINALATQ